MYEQYKFCKNLQDLIDIYKDATGGDFGNFLMIDLDANRFFQNLKEFEYIIYDK